ncbi:hypothetical protein N7530_010193 [Penicillium desertorum]|uniref:Uncharacterized protein n=1 Tax=Penicillium desertorum TaxID=1303715 RepID=A0A9X0BJ42_9EURO|nr:hypothetical protein N7530_010193 [Penicillium desertorum]
MNLLSYEIYRLVGESLDDLLQSMDDCLLDVDITVDGDPADQPATASPRSATRIVDFKSVSRYHKLQHSPKKTHRKASTKGHPSGNEYIVAPVHSDHSATTHAQLRIGAARHTFKNGWLPRQVLLESLESGAIVEYLCNYFSSARSTEVDIVLFDVDMVRTRSLRFMRHPQRLNVAFSRGRYA